MTAPDKITLARRIGSRHHTTLEPGETMSHGYTDAQPYHHQRTVDELLEAAEPIASLSRDAGPQHGFVTVPITQIDALDALIAKHRKGG